MSSMTDGRGPEFNFLINFFIKPGLVFSDRAMLFLERKFPRLKDKQENLYGIRNSYLEKYNLSGRETRKRNLKTMIKSYILFLFYLAGCATLVFTYQLAGLLFNLPDAGQYLINLIFGVFLVSIILAIFLFFYAAYSLHKINEKD